MCEAIYKRKREGHSPIELEWEDGNSVRGEYFTDFHLLIGFQARSRVPITYGY